MSPLLSADEIVGNSPYGSGVAEVPDQSSAANGFEETRHLI